MQTPGTGAGSTPGLAVAVEERHGDGVPDLAKRRRERAVAQVAQTGAAADCLVSRNWSIAARAQWEV